MHETNCVNVRLNEKYVPPKYRYTVEYGVRLTKESKLLQVFIPFRFTAHRSQLHGYHFLENHDGVIHISV